MLFRRAADTMHEEGDEHVLILVVMREARFNGRMEEEEEEGKWAYVELPAEAAGGVGRLCRWPCGMRHAASAWHAHYTNQLESAGFVRGQAAPTVLYNDEWEGRLVAHGDDVKFLCPRRVGGVW